MNREVRSHLLDVAHCPIVAQCLDSPDSTHPCSTVVRYQWRSRTPDERIDHWRSFHQLPEPWNGHLATAKLLFISSNPSLRGELPADLATAPLKSHWITCATGDEDIVDRYEESFSDKYMDGGTRLKGEPRAQPYWAGIKARAKELFGRPVEPGDDYAITEAVRCKSPDRTGVREALKACAGEYLDKTIQLSGARVIVAVGDEARRLLPKVLEGVTDMLAQDVRLGERQLLVTYIPAPGSPKPGKFANTHTPAQIKRLQNALR